MRPVSLDKHTTTMNRAHSKCIGILTSGGDAPGMNAAVRAAVRTALDRGVQVYAICEGYQGMVDGGGSIRPMTWTSVSGVLHRGGTSIGTARCKPFRERAGRLAAARNLLQLGIDALVVVGGDGSLTGAHLLRQEWPELLAALVADGSIAQETADRHAALTVVGLVGSIDNDMSGTDMTIGADTALSRITDAVDALSSTAASHQRTFVVEVMGRNCGYLALMSALATGADWVFIPEHPPEVDDWEQAMCDVLKAGRAAGRRDSIVIVAEGARDRQGQPITSSYIQQVLQERMQQDTRVTILGHVQRGGAPSAFDRYMSTLLGHAAVEHILDGPGEGPPQLIGMRENRVHAVPLADCLQQTRSVAEAIGAHDYEQAMALRGGSFREAYHTFQTLAQSLPRPPRAGQQRLRLAVINASGPAPGMNTATRAAVRLGLDQGHIMLGVRNGFQGLVEGEIEEMAWMTVEDWAWMGGSELGTNRKVPGGKELYQIARNLEEYEIQGLLIIGGWAGYEAAYQLMQNRDKYPAFHLPMICLPASINNNLPGSELSVGADTALNNIVGVVDKIKQSAVASSRVFVVEVMGRYCGYLALMSGLATGAERVYIHEEGVTLRDLQTDVDLLSEGFREGKRLGLVIRNEYANAVYTTPFMSALFEEEGGDLFEVRQSILGHLQQGGNPTPFDRIQATRMAARCLSFLIEKAGRGQSDSAFIGLQGGHVQLHSLEDFPRMVDAAHKRPREEWWMHLLPIARILAQPGPAAREAAEAAHPA